MLFRSLQSRPFPPWFRAQRRRGDAGAHRRDNHAQKHARTQLSRVPTTPVAFCAHTTSRAHHTRSSTTSAPRRRPPSPSSGPHLPDSSIPVSVSKSEPFSSEIQLASHVCSSSVGSLFHHNHNHSLVAAHRIRNREIPCSNPGRGIGLRFASFSRAPPWAHLSCTQKPSHLHPHATTAPAWAWPTGQWLRIPVHRVEKVPQIQIGKSVFTARSLKFKCT